MFMYIELNQRIDSPICILTIMLFTEYVHTVQHYPPFRVKNGRGEDIELKQKLFIYFFNILHGIRIIE
jgi:hypothetical protein